ncbi:hypothetical protein J3R74_002012 [Puniceicoccus vermicola]
MTLVVRSPPPLLRKESSRSVGASPMAHLASPDRRPLQRVGARCSHHHAFPSRPTKVGTTNPLQRKKRFLDHPIPIPRTRMTLVVRSPPPLLRKESSRSVGASPMAHFASPDRLPLQRVGARCSHHHAFPSRPTKVGTTNPLQRKKRFLDHPIPIPRTRMT